MTNISHEELTDFLRRNGWRHGEPGAFGSLWALDDGEPVGITHSLASTSPDWGTTLERLGLSMQLDAKTVEHRIANALIDEIAFRVPTASDEIPLSVGLALFTLAHRAVRASATSSQGSRPIVENVPRGARRIIEQVSVAHTRPGSYVVPIRYQLDRTLTEPAMAAERAQQDPLERDWEENREAPQRRASRTLMQALGLLDSEVLRPERMPNADMVRSLVPAGVTRELVSAVRAMVVTSQVDQVTATAEWATAVREPAQAASEVVVEREAADLLKVVAQRLGELQPHPLGEVISGPLVSLDIHGAGPDRSAGVPATVGVQVIRHGRQSTVLIDTEPEIWGDVNRWLETGEVVMAFGTVKSGKHLRLERRGPLGPVGQAVLPGI